ncbi:MAG: hypothetical protein LBI85_01195, partial [Spirochaetaceae bacterium]|nr:hypothetical protein [Spirochaetaceae bacterium]
TGGIVYGSDAIGNDGDGNPLKNTATNGDTNGHAVFYGQWVDVSTTVYYYRDATLDTGDNIDTASGQLPTDSGPAYGVNNWIKK